jgi:hypothetical protein
MGACYTENPRIIVMVCRLLQSTNSPDSVLGDPVELLRTASLAHIPVDPDAAKCSPVKTEHVPLPLDSTDRLNVLVSALKNQPWYKGQIVDERTFAVKEERTGKISTPLSQQIAAALWDSRKITNLYSHQVSAIEALSQKKHVIVSTSTASGKSVIYQIPILQHLEMDSGSTALFIYPTKVSPSFLLRKIFTIKSGSCSGPKRSIRTALGLVCGASTPSSCNL